MSPSPLKHITRRQFLGRAAVATASIALFSDCQSIFTKKGVKTATDLIPLGKSGIKVSRLGMGTGTNGGRIQREMGQKAFTAMIRHGIERGVTFIDTADNYNEMHEMVREAIKGLDREKLQIQCKIPGSKYDDPLKELDRFRFEIGTDYFDSFLLHHAHTPDWPEKEQRIQDLLEEAKHRQIIRSHGVSIHGMPALNAADRATPWIDVAFVRVNHNGRHMDGVEGKFGEPGLRDQALLKIEKMHREGKGIIGMKLIGNGDFTERRDRVESIRFAMSLDYIDAAVIGFKSTQEIDEAIATINAAFVDASNRRSS